MPIMHILTLLSTLIVVEFLSKIVLYQTDRTNQLAKTLIFDRMSSASVDVLKYFKMLDFNELFSCLMDQLQHADNFEIWYFEMIYHWGLKWVSIEYFHHGWRKCWISIFWNALELRISTGLIKYQSVWLKKILNLIFWNAPQWRISVCLWWNNFTMVEINFEFWYSEMLQSGTNGGVSVVKQC